MNTTTSQCTPRPHLGLSVSALAASVDFYRGLFGIEPSKLRPGYAKFELVEPPLNLTLNEVQDLRQRFGPATHFGIELPSTSAVDQAHTRARTAGLVTDQRASETCCYAVQDKFWVTDPDGHQWEHFVVTQADVPESKSPTAPPIVQPDQSGKGTPTGSQEPCCAPTCCDGAGATQ